MNKRQWKKLCKTKVKKYPKCEEGEFYAIFFDFVNPSCTQQDLGRFATMLSEISYGEVIVVPHPHTMDKMNLNELEQVNEFIGRFIEERKDKEKG